jgi:hypothetical protein
MDELKFLRPKELRHENARIASDKVMQSIETIRYPKREPSDFEKMAKAAESAAKHPLTKGMMSVFGKMGDVAAKAGENYEHNQRVAAQGRKYRWEK